MSDAFSLMELFREEARSHAATLNQGLLELETDAANPQRLEPLMRAAHSIKGAARIVGIDLAVHLAHALEDAFVAAQQGKIRIGSGDIDVLLRGADLLAGLSDVAEEGLTAWAASKEAEIGELSMLIQGISQGLSPAPNADGPISEPVNTVAPPVPLPPPCVEPPLAVAAVVPVKETLPAAPTATSIPAESAEAVVRVTAQSLNRLMSLAGESLVQARWLQPFATSLLKLKKHQDHLAALLDNLALAQAAGRRGDDVPVMGGIDEARRQAALCRQVLTERIGEFEDHAAQAEDHNSRLYREVIVSRMRPFADGAQGFPRMVRDLARRLNKQVRLDIIGPSTEVDRDILEKLEAPLTHLLRNAVDHGIEPSEQRLAAGKPESGSIRVDVQHRAGMLAITIADDGGGIDRERLRRKIVERGLANPDLVHSLGEAELLEFLFLPGFSTTDAVTEFSGRGVGLDVVQDTIRRIGGSVRVSTRPGAGTTFHLQVPITLSVLRAVLVDIASEPYAFPHNRIDRLLRIRREAIRSLENRQFITVDGQNVGLVIAAQLFELSPSPSPSSAPSPMPASGSASAGDELCLVLMSDSSGYYGLIVDGFRGEQDLVVRPLDPLLGKVPNLSAAAILDDGTPVLIADVEDLIRSMDHLIQARSLKRSERTKTAVAARKRVLVVDDSITVREVERHLLQNAGYDVTVAVDGQEGWNMVRAQRFDLVVSDVDMPRMNGLELLKAVRQNDSVRHLPLIIVSYKDREEDRLRGLDLGANYYLTKSSFHNNTFLQAVVDLIGPA